MVRHLKFPENEGARLKVNIRRGCNLLFVSNLRLKFPIIHFHFQYLEMVMGIVSGDLVRKYYGKITRRISILKGTILRGKSVEKIPEIYTNLNRAGLLYAAMWLVRHRVRASIHGPIRLWSTMWVKCGHLLGFARVITHITREIAHITMWVISHVRFQLGSQFLLRIKWPIHYHLLFDVS